MVLPPLWFCGNLWGSTPPKNWWGTPIELQEERQMEALDLHCTMMDRPFGFPFVSSPKRVNRHRPIRLELDGIHRPPFWFSHTLYPHTRNYAINFHPVPAVHVAVEPTRGCLQEEQRSAMATWVGGNIGSKQATWEMLERLTTGSFCFVFLVYCLSLELCSFVCT